MDDTLKELLRYAGKLGVEMTGITPRRLPGRGYGMVATRNIKEGETVLDVPTRALRTLATVPRAISRKLDRDVSVHGILAAELLLDKSGDYAAWDAVLPTPADLEAGMPLLWPAALQDLLPTPAKEALAKQKAKLERDWAPVQAAFFPKSSSSDSEKSGREKNDSDRTRYVHAWLLVNSRTFYYTTPRSERTLASREDRIAMQPIADLFNHAADHGCRAAYAADGFAFVADRPYQRGDEVPISYGAHANDALLVEYGFILPDGANRWDEAALDAVVLPRLTTRAQRDDLQAAGFLGRYMIDADTPGGCYRTQVALRRILCGPGAGGGRRAAWQRFVDEGGASSTATNGNAAARSSSSDELSQARVDELLRECLDDMAEHIHEKLESISKLGKKGVGSESQRSLLAHRWRQIEAMVAQAAQRLPGNDSEE